MVVAGEVSGYAWLSVSMIVIAAYMVFCWQSILHEAVHQMACSSRFMNVWGGRLLAMMGFTSYTLYREVHKSHHAYMNRFTDVELWPYVDPKVPLWFRRCFVWFDLLFGVLATPLIFARAYLSRNSPIKDHSIRCTIRTELLCMIAFWALVWSVTTYLGTWRNHAFGVLLPLFLAGVIQTTRKLTEHLGMKSYDPLLGTRTVVPGNLLIKTASFLNFDLFVHGPHHRHPRLANDGLAPKMCEYVEQHRDINYPVFPTYWRASFAMLPYLFNPGSGMNAGAPPPGRLKKSGQLDFVGDVVEEILADESPSVTDDVTKDARESAH